jgi:hypothetical protein
LKKAALKNTPLSKRLVFALFKCLPTWLVSARSDDERALTDTHQHTCRGVLLTNEPMPCCRAPAILGTPVFE